ncbi:MAG: prenyltransferase [Clostridium sp.]|nr:prenyltransferase [Clostridium sp.]
MEKLLFWLNCTRAYSLPMSVMAWLIPFTLGYFNNGKILYGFLALLGIICAHLGANLFDDIIDYKNYLKNKKSEQTINLKKGKCQYFLDNKLSMILAVKAVIILFAIALAIGFYFIEIYRFPVLVIMSITGILCLLYPKSGYFALSEIIIGTIFSPLLFTGVYYVMTGTFSLKLIWLSVSFALVTITLLYTDFFLDFNSDKAEGKKTLCTISGSKHNAYYLYIFIIFLIYANLFLGIHAHIFPLKYAIIFISALYALKTIGQLQNYIDKEIKSEKEFMTAMNTTQKFIAIFTVLCLICFYLTK